jgi:Cap4 dsDNA endonuclease
VSQLEFGDGRMTNLLTTVSSAKPREKSGASPMARYGFQVHASILKMLDLHESGRDYRAVFDHFDDLMVFDKANQPENVDFYQIKSQSKGSWSLKEMTKKSGTGSPPLTFLGRLHHHMGAFGQMVTTLGFMSNMGFKLKLADGSLTTDDHHKVCSADLHSDEIAALKDAVTKDAITPPAVDGSSLFVFERTGLGIKDQETFIRGRLLEFVHARGGTDPVPVMSLYETLRGSVLTKTGVTQEFTTEAEFYDLKTLCRADIEAMFLRATSGGRFHESWAIIQTDLMAADMTPLQALGFYNGCLRYTKARSSGEPGAVGFQEAAINAILAHRVEIDACNSLSEAAKELEKWVPTGYEHRAGAIYVESFEAIK